MKNYLYTVGWFQSVVQNIQKHLSVFADKPVTGLEVGCFEGMSTVWLLENILTHADSKLVVIDPFTGNPELSSFDMTTVHRRYNHNIEETGKSSQVKTIVGDSKLIIPHIPDDSLDFAYIDGSHEACDVLADGRLSFPKLKKGGVMIFDDYGWTEPVDPIHKPVMGINFWLEEFKGEYRLLEINYQVAIKKL